MERFLWVSFAGALGSGARYLVGLWATKALGASFPYGTLIVNLFGCFAISAVMQAALSTSFVSPGLRIALTSGFLGGLTTYSAFNYETLKLFEERSWWLGTIYFALTALGCIAMGLAGAFLAKRLLAT
jgi:fluoride exporter